MIKANELRIGNWLILNCGDDYSRPENYCIDAIDIGVCVGNEERFSPIPLTPEILEKCGFVTDESEVGYNLGLPNGEGVDLTIEDEGDPSKSCCLIRKHTCDGVYNGDYDYCYIKDVRHVHQLQNLYFALTGEELTISL